MSFEITYEEMSQLPAESFVTVDIRSFTEIESGMISGAVHLPHGQLLQRKDELPSDKLCILYCEKGIVSIDAAVLLNSFGINARSLKGGYQEYVLKRSEERDKSSRNADIERSLQTKFNRSIFSRFTKAIKEYELIKPEDSIAVCISGGKDSMLMAKLFQMLHRYTDIPFSLSFLVMDPGYSEMNRKMIESNAEILGIPITIFETDIFSSVYNIENNPCYLCARMRRGHLYAKAKELGCNKIALGHHFDDVIETILMSMIYGGQVETMLPKLHSANFEGMQIIRPMYLIRESEVKHWAAYNDLHFIQCACRFTDTCTTCSPDSRTSSKRMEIKQLIAKLAEGNPQIEKNIFRSVENINLNKIVSYKKDGVIHSFLDGYDD